MDLDILDADWVSRGTSYILLWLSLILARSLARVIHYSSVTCVDSPVLCRLSMLSCFLTPSYRLVGLAPAAAKCSCVKYCICSILHELFSQWRPQLRTRIVNPHDLTLGSL